MPDDHSLLEPRLPISNRTVKRQHADDSAHLARESRSSSGTHTTHRPALKSGPVCYPRSARRFARGQCITLLIIITNPAMNNSHSIIPILASLTTQRTAGGARRTSHIALITHTMPATGPVKIDIGPRHAEESSSQYEMSASTPAARSCVFRRSWPMNPTMLTAC